MRNEIDLFVIGGGVNGAGIARDAAGRGLSVVLCEQADLAQGTSSRSGKLIHGGLRYLEYYEFRLVRKALIERDILLRAAPHIIWPMRFVLPHSPNDRPAWLIRLGLFLYDTIGGRRRLPGTRSVDLLNDPVGAPIRNEYTRGFEYSDCWVDDARLVVLNAVDARELGAQVLPRTVCKALRVEEGRWTATVEDVQTGTEKEFYARAVVNAAGPWVNQIIDRVARGNSSRAVRLVKGSHIIVPKFWDGQQAYLVQNHDRRVIFINPYEGDKALIGTTDCAYEGRPEDVAVDDEEVDYLIAVVNRYFKQELRRDDIVEAFSGVRPLFDDGQGNPSAVTRDYQIDLDRSLGAPMLNIFGGKITTFRKLAEHALQKLKPVFSTMGEDWTANVPLPGGNVPNGDFENFLGVTQNDYPWLPQDLLKHYARLYGTRIVNIIGSAQSLNDLGQRFGPLLYEAEVVYLVDQEWAICAEDILKRRTKHGLHLGAAQIAELEKWFDSAAAKTA